MTSTDRRTAPRFRPAHGTVCRINREPEPGVGLVWDISTSGVSMLVADPPAPGAILAGELTGEDVAIGLPVLLQAVHARPTSTGDYILGARFLRPLSEHELTPFLTPQPKDADES
jgi:hypothetical protein